MIRRPTRSGSRALLDEDDCQKGTACRMMLDNFDDGVDAVDEMDDDVSAR